MEEVVAGLEAMSARALRRFADKFLVGQNVGFDQLQDRVLERG